MIGLASFAKIKNNYCVCYFGHADEYLLQLKMLKPALEKAFPGLKVFFGCRDDRIHLLAGCDKSLMVSELKSRREEFAHIRELKFDGVKHPVEDLMDEAGVNNLQPVPEPPHRTNICVVSVSGSHPTMPMEKRVLDCVKRRAKDDGYEVVVGGNSATAGMVVGVEGYALYEAAARGIRTALVPTGVGTRLYKRLVMNGEVWDT